MILTRPFKRSACEHLEYLKNSSWEEINACIFYLDHIKLVYQQIIKSSQAILPIRCQQCSDFNRIHVNLTQPKYYCIGCISKQKVLTADFYISVDHSEVFCTACNDYIYDDEIYYLQRYFDTLLLKDQIPKTKSTKFAKYIVERPFLETEQILISKPTVWTTESESVSSI